MSPVATTPVLVIGADGRVGKLACALIADADDLTLAAEIDREDDLDELMGASGAACGLDVTVAGLGAKHARIMLEAGVRPVIGTSGVTPEEVRELDGFARERGLGGLVVPNFSLGMWAAQDACERIARHFAQVEIVESHHADKQDAPSGTALDTAERIRRAREDAGHVRGGEVPIHSIRLPGLFSNQEVVFGGPGEIVRVAHETCSLEAFAPGILAALRYARTAEGVASGIGHALS